MSVRHDLDKSVKQAPHSCGYLQISTAGENTVICFEKFMKTRKIS